MDFCEYVKEGKVKLTLEIVGKIVIKYNISLCPAKRNIKATEAAFYHNFKTDI